MAYALLQGMKATRGAISPVLAERGLHPGQDLMLSALWREDGITQAELAARLGIEAPTVSRALQRPVEQAWRNADRRLRRRIGPDDLAALRRILGRLTSS